MAGTLHIFRRSVVGGFPSYQANYTYSSKSFARVFDSEDLLREFLIEGVALGPSDVDDLLDELNHSGKATLTNVSIEETAAAELGMTESPSDF
ncbi:MAG TPA: hypothetical protein VN622_16985 [Clostridia bacterium]|nr:hypothetical protein [Clostridia bacterium]